MTIDRAKLDGVTDKVLSYNSSPKQHKLDISQESLFIEHKVEGVIVAQRPNDGHINATELCKKLGKQFTNYYNLKTTLEFLTELSSVNRIPLTGIIQKRQGGRHMNKELGCIHK